MSARPPLRAPRQDGGIVAEPPLDRVGAILATNRRRLAGHVSDVLGTPANRLRTAARAEVLHAAREYLGTSTTPSPEAPVLMAGHQPELFHPGVWVKNFTLAGLARRHGGVAVNLVVDNDTIKATALRVPVPPDEAHAWPRLATVPFDFPTGDAPYEEAVVRDEACFADFADRVGALMRGWGYEPLLDDLWDEARRQIGQTPLLGERLARARRTLERRWGCDNLEVPVSRVCRGDAFAHFACHLLINLQPFHDLYNATVHAYRQRHEIRSVNRPVPDLGQDGDWLETPFWAWRRGQTRRGRLLARLVGGRLELRSGTDAWPALPWSADDPGRLVRAWQDLEGQGLKVRSRALTNTLYARVFLSDVFLHGIGGGEYDELTDELIRGFYGVEPPDYLVLSATRLLPLPAYPATAEECRRLARLVRDLHWNPERHQPTESDASLRSLLVEKRRLMRSTPTDADSRRERFRALRSVNDRLRPSVADAIRRAGEGLERCRREVEANGLLRRRDYAFCLYPESVLRPFCTQFLD